MAHKITVVMFPPSQKGVEVKTPFAKAELYTLVNESVHDRIGRFQAETDNMLFQITEVKEVLDVVLDGTDVPLLPIMSSEVPAAVAA